MMQGHVFVLVVGACLCIASCSSLSRFNDIDADLRPIRTLCADGKFSFRCSLTDGRSL